MARPPADWAALPADVHLAVQRRLSLAERCRCLCVCRAWHATGAGLHELWESVETGWDPKPKCSEPLLQWLDAWCATQQRPLRQLELLNMDNAPGVAAGSLVAVLQRSSTSLQHLKLLYNDSLWEQLVRGERQHASGFLAAIAALQQLTSLEIHNDGSSNHVLPPASTVLPTSLQRLVYDCGELPRQASQLMRLEHLTLDAPLPASLALPPSMRGLTVACSEVPEQLTQLTQLEELGLDGRFALSDTTQHVAAIARLTRLTSLAISRTNFSMLPPSWTMLSSLRKLELDDPGPLKAARALQPLGSWTQLTALCIRAKLYSGRPLAQQLTRLSALQRLSIGTWVNLELPPGRWQGHLTSLQCDLRHVLSPAAHPPTATAALAHATALRRLEARAEASWCSLHVIEEIEADLGPARLDAYIAADYVDPEDWDEYTASQLTALLGALAALPALQRAQLGNWHLKDMILQAHTALGSPLGARLLLHNW